MRSWRQKDVEEVSVTSSEDFSRDREPTTCCENRFCDAIRSITISSKFSLFVAVIIVLNVVVMAVQADFPTLILPKDCTSNCINVWTVVNISFLVFFSIELTMRFITFGWSFFTDEADWSWNVFDFSVVMLGWFDLLSKLLIRGNGGGNLVMIIRIIRILRILRVLRLFRQLKKLTMLVRGLIESMNVVFWITLLILSMILVMAIFCTTLIGQNKQDWGPEADEIDLHWGSVLRSSLTLFSFLTLDDWSNMTRQVMRVQPVMLFIFLAYVVVAAFVVLSLLTGVMAEHMNAVRTEEDRDGDRERQLEMGGSMKIFFRAFKALDKDEDHVITLHEFQHLLKLPEIEEELNNLEISLKGIDTSELFESFDRDNDRQLTWDEFKNGFEEFRKGTHPRQVFKLQATLQRVVAHHQSNGSTSPAKAPPQMSADLERKLEEMNSNISGMGDRVGVLHAEVKELVDALKRRRGQAAFRKN